PSPQAQGTIDLPLSRASTFEPREMTLDDPDGGQLRRPSRVGSIQARRRSGSDPHRGQEADRRGPSPRLSRIFDRAEGQLKEYAGCAGYARSDEIPGDRA